MGAIERLREVVEAADAPDDDMNAWDLYDDAAVRLTRALVAEGERERLARIIRPWAFENDGTYDQAGALLVADDILDHLATLALGESPSPPESAGS